MKLKKIIVTVFVCAFLVCTLQTTFAEDNDLTSGNGTINEELIGNNDSSTNSTVVVQNNDSSSRNIRGLDSSINSTEKIVTNSTVIVLGDLKVDKPVVILGLLRDEFDNPLGNIVLNIDINGKKYSVTTNSEGYWTLSLNPPLSEGKKSLSVRWGGDDTYKGFVNQISYKISKYDSKMSISTRIIKEGQKATIKTTLRDGNGKALANKKVSITINKKTYTKTTNRQGIASFSIKGLKGGKKTVNARFKGDSLFYGSTISKVQSVKPRVDLAIVRIKTLRSANKQLATYKITIQNKGSLRSKATRLVFWHEREYVKIKSKSVKIGSIAPGKKKSFIVTYYPDRDHHRYCIGEYFVVNPKKTMNEISYKNNKARKT